MGSLRAATCLIICVLALNAADGGQVWVGDDRTGELFEPAAKLAAPVATARRVRLKIEVERGLTAGELLEDVDKLVLRREPTQVLIAVGSLDLWDFRKNGPIDGADRGATLGAIAEAAATIRATGASVGLVTPLAEPTDSPARPVMADLAAGLRELASSGGYTLVDVFAASANDGAYGKRGRLESEATRAIATRIAAAAGLGRTSLPDLRPEDRVVVFTDVNHMASRVTRLSELDEAFAARYGERVHLVIVEKPLDQVVKDPSFIANQRPRVLVLCYGHGRLASDEPTAQLRAELEQVLVAVEELRIPDVMLMTPLPLNELDQLDAWQPGGALAGRSLAWADEVTALGAERGLPVIDLTAAAIERHRADPTITFLPQNKAGSSYRSITEGGIQAVAAALIEAWQLDGEG